MAPTDLRLSALIREAMNRDHLTQAAVADLLGISREAVSARLNGRTLWTVSEVAALGRALDINPGVLLDAASDGYEVLSA